MIRVSSVSSSSSSFLSYHTTASTVARRWGRLQHHYSRCRPDSLQNNRRSLHTVSSFQSDYYRSAQSAGVAAREVLQQANESAISFEQTYQRKPSLAVITVGTLPGSEQEQHCLELDNSYPESGQQVHICFDIQEVNLNGTTTTDLLLSKIYGLLKTNQVDGIQVKWPLPDHIDAVKIYNAIPLEKDVDGAHYIGQKELSASFTPPGTRQPFPPVAPAAVISLMKEYNMQMKNKHILVVGHSCRILGSPLALMLRDEEGAVVTTAGAHSEVSSCSQEKLLQKLVSHADIIITCAGSPGLLKAQWLKPNAEVISIGTILDDEKKALVSDFDKEDLSSHVKRYSSITEGVGPFSLPFLLQNVAAAAWERETSVIGEVERCWSKKPGALTRSIHFKDYDKAIEFANKVNDMSRKIDHHANMAFSHKCVNGVDLNIEFFTFEANNVTEKDYIAAKNVDDILQQNQREEKLEIRMSDYSYQLKPESIAKYPAYPRGSSRLLRVDETGTVSHYDNFTKAFPELAKGSHLIFNESKVSKARLFVKAKNQPIASRDDEGIEMMMLDIGDIVAKKVRGVKIPVMIRKVGVQLGDEFIDTSSGRTSFKVSKVVSDWKEDEKSHGNGTECIAECIPEIDVTLSELLEIIGTVPIPPYLDRSAEDSDETAYNNVYAGEAGSVAAPTAGLHFTDGVLQKIGADNTSFLSLHVGAGTFKPVSTKNALDHVMHGEPFKVDAAQIRRVIHALESQKRLIVVGTTSCRTLESLYWCGVKNITGIIDGGDGDFLELGQFEWSDLKEASKGISAADSLKMVVEGCKTTTIGGRTNLMIVPGSYEFKVVHDLVTNFHAPDSTLMLLVSAFLGSGEKVRNVYEDAQLRGYRFLSYGDSCFFSRPRK